MLEWLRQQSLTLGDVLAAAGLAVTIAVVAFPPSRRLVKGWLLRAGGPEYSYAAWFVNKWGCTTTRTWPSRRTSI